ncbi:MAG TPA: MFS transporter, partial [Thiomicrospira sp.]|nr:MFS transporter [Thiomicrospira sp.]
MLKLSSIQQYGLITANYWAFTITDGALRMLVLLFFYQLGYSPLEIATLFLLYELFGIITNLVGGWLGARFGLKMTMNVGLILQIIALLMLTVDESLLGLVYVMFAQALSGIAKDLNKMSAKSAVKSLVLDERGELYKWVSRLTGSKNSLKGVGFFVGAFLLSNVGFVQALQWLASLIALVLVVSILFVDANNGKEKNQSKFSEMFSKSSAINWLSVARFFLFGARDIWFVVALPLYLVGVLHWPLESVGAFMAIWVIAYGVVQAFAPTITGLKSKNSTSQPTASLAMKLGFVLM